jgi:hypothetical protein
MLLSVFVVVAQTEEKQEYAKKKRTEWSCSLSKETKNQSKRKLTNKNKTNNDGLLRALIKTCLWV